MSAQQDPIKRTELLRQDLADLPGHQGIVFISEVAPGAVTPRHHHPGHEVLYILDGSGTWEVDGKPLFFTKAGDVFYQPPHQVHCVRNDSGTAPLKVLVFLIAPSGQPLAIPAQP